MGFMKFYELIQLLHKYIGVDKRKYEFIQWLPTLLMRDAISDEECEEEDNECYYPFSTINSNQNFRSSIGRIYSGKREITKEDAAKIIRCYDDTKLKEEFDSLENIARRGMVEELKKYGIYTVVDEVENAVSLLFKTFLTAISNGIKEIEIPKSLSISTLRNNWNDDSLKIHFGPELLSEVGYKCPMTGCFKNLLIKKDANSEWFYNIIPVSGDITEEDPANLIALCPECAKKSLMSLNSENFKELRKIKNFFSSQSLIENDWHESPELLKSVGKVIDKLSKIPFDKLCSLNYNPVEVDRKIKKDNPQLYYIIKNFVVNHYHNVDNLMKDAEIGQFLDYERFSMIIRWHYKDLIKQKNISQELVFEKLSKWLALATNESELSCQIVVAYFVQKCEVFDDITK